MMNRKYKWMFMIIGVSVFCIGAFSGCGGKVQEKDNLPTRSGLVSQENGITDQTGEEDNGWENSTCCYREDLSRWDDDYESGDEEVIYLAQYDKQGNKLQEFSYAEFGMEDELYIEILAARDHELLFSYELDDDEWDIYSVPLEHKDGKETVAFDKISMVCKGLPWGVYLYGDDDYLIFGNGKSILEVCRADKNYKKIRADVRDLTLFRQRADEENRLIYFGGSSKEGYQGLFAYAVGGGTIRQVTSRDCMNTLFAMGGGKLFYTAVRSENGGLCYDLFQYDNAVGETTTLATESEIVGKMPAAPTEGSDVVREIRYQDGKIYMEVWAKQEKYVLCCDAASRELTVEEGIKCLVEHTESKLDEPLYDADAEYGNANGQNIFISASMPDGGIGLREYTLQGEFVRNVYTHYCGEIWNLLYANNEELIFGVGGEDDEDIYSVPLRKVDGNDFPVMGEAKRICKVSEYGACIRSGNIYADADYLVYVSNVHEAAVYDRKAGKHIDIKNMPRTNFYFAAGSGKISQNRVGDCFIYCTKPYGKNEDKYAFSYWRPGEDHLTMIDKRCYTAASRACDTERNQVIYELDDGIWCYNIKDGKRRKLLDIKDVETFIRKHAEKFFYAELFVDRDQLYIVDTVSGCCGSFDLEKGGEIRYEEKFSEMLKEDEGFYVETIEQTEGKFLITLTPTDEDSDLPCRYRYYEPQTAEGKTLSPTDKEMLYFKLH